MPMVINSHGLIGCPDDLDEIHVNCHSETIQMRATIKIGQDTYPRLGLAWPSPANEDLIRSDDEEFSSCVIIIIIID